MALGWQVPEGPKIRNPHYLGETQLNLPADFNLFAQTAAWKVMSPTWTFAQSVSRRQISPENSSQPFWVSIKSETIYHYEFFLLNFYWTDS